MRTYWEVFFCVCGVLVTPVGVDTGPVIAAFVSIDGDSVDSDVVGFALFSITVFVGADRGCATKYKTPPALAILMRPRINIFFMV